MEQITLQPGMDFLDRQKWWADGEWRRRPHEGVDLVSWTDAAGEKSFLGEGTKVPCLISGEIIAICDDFLGSSVFVKGKDLLHGDIVAVHAHILPMCRQGEPVAIGEEIGRIAPGNGAVPAHLHLSLLRFSQALPWGYMDWRYLNAKGLSLFLNPFA